MCIRDSQSMEQELSVFSNKNTVSVMIIARATPSTWTPETLLLRGITRGGTELLFIATGQAISSMQGMRMKIAYDIDIAGKCLKEPRQAPRLGVASPFDVRFQYPAKINLASTAWPTQVPYKMIKFLDIDQLDNGTFLDVVGHVTRVGALDKDGPIDKKVIQLQQEALV